MNSEIDFHLFLLLLID